MPLSCIEEHHYGLSDLPGLLDTGGPDHSGRLPAGAGALIGAGGRDTACEQDTVSPDEVGVTYRVVSHTDGDQACRVVTFVELGSVAQGDPVGLDHDDQGADGTAQPHDGAAGFGRIQAHTHLKGVGDSRDDCGLPGRPCLHAERMLAG